MKTIATRPEHYAVMRSSFIKHRLESIESTLYVLKRASESDAEPIEMSKAIGMVIDGVNDTMNLIDEMIEEIRKPER